MNVITLQCPRLFLMGKCPVYPCLRERCSLYYAYGMTKKFGRLPKKHVLIGVVAGVLILGAGAYAAKYFYTQHKTDQAQKTAEQKKLVDAERTKLDDVAFRGDKDVAAQYMERISAKDTTGAARVYERAAADADKTKQAELYKNAITAARQAKQDEQVLQFSLKLAEVQPEYRIYAAIADLYAARQDSAHQIEYLQKTIDSINALPKDSLIYVNLLPLYQNKLKAVQS